MCSADRGDGSTKTSIKVIELGDDESIENIDDAAFAARTEPCKSSRPSSFSAMTLAPSVSKAATSNALVVSNRSHDFQPRLEKKRQKVERQLRLDGLFRMPSS